jgi:imidazoleglycerol phosphate dehydratase HisB
MSKSEGDFNICQHHIQEDIAIQRAGDMSQALTVIFAVKAFLDGKPSRFSGALE